MKAIVMTIMILTMIIVCVCNEEDIEDRRSSKIMDQWKDSEIILDQPKKLLPNDNDNVKY